MRTKTFVLSTMLGSLLASNIAIADTSGNSAAADHAPIGVMADHTHNKGEFMFSYRYMSMDMEGNRNGTDSISPEEIVTTIPNRLAGNPMQPPTLRVVPSKMSMGSHMFGAMYAPSDQLTLMLMVPYKRYEMDHITFRGPKGTDRLGSFTTRSSGFGDTKLSGLFGVHDSGQHKIHLSLGVSLPTGSITKKDAVLTPMGMRPELRLPYPMQLGSGTYDLLPGITYRGQSDSWNWGAQYMGTIRTGENDEDYTLGDEHKLTAWTAYSWSQSLSTSLRFAYLDTGNIDGADPQIAAPVQTADPDNQGKKRLDLHAGVNYLSHSGHRFAFEVGAPVHQDLDGPQLETDWTITAGYQYAF